MSIEDTLRDAHGFHRSATLGSGNEPDVSHPKIMGKLNDPGCFREIFVSQDHTYGCVDSVTQPPNVLDDLLPLTLHTGHSVPGTCTASIQGDTEVIHPSLDEFLIDFSRSGPVGRHSHSVTSETCESYQ